VILTPQYLLTNSFRICEQYLQRPCDQGLTVGQIHRAEYYALTRVRNQKDSATTADNNNNSISIDSPNVFVFSRMHASDRPCAFWSPGGIDHLTVSCILLICAQPGEYNQTWVYQTQKAQMYFHLKIELYSSVLIFRSRPKCSLSKCGGRFFILYRSLKSWAGSQDKNPNE